MPAFAGGGRESEGQSKMEKAAVLIHSRTRYRDYRQKFLVRPVDMEETQIYHWRGLVQRCTVCPEELRRTRKLRRAVISADGYIAVGAAGYFRDLYPAAFEDEGGRPVQGFVGLVWKREDMPAQLYFPSVQVFRSAVTEYMIPRWEEPVNCLDGEKASFSDYRDRREDGGEWGWPDSPEEEKGLEQALRQAKDGEDVFFCAGLPAEEKRKEEGGRKGEAAKKESAGQRHASLKAAAAVCLICAAVMAAVCLFGAQGRLRVLTGVLAGLFVLAWGWETVRLVCSGRQTKKSPAGEICEMPRKDRRKGEEEGRCGDDIYLL